MRLRAVAASLRRRLVATANLRRPLLAAVAAVCLAAVALALGTRPSAGTETLADPDAPAAVATARVQEAFGEPAVTILVRGPLPELVLTENLGRLLALEGCLAGHGGSFGGPCAALAARRPAQLVTGPGTFVNTAAEELAVALRARAATARRGSRTAQARARRAARARGLDPDEAAAAVRRLADARFARELLELDVRYGLGLARGAAASAPMARSGVAEAAAGGAATALSPRDRVGSVASTLRIDDPAFVSAVVFDGRRGADVPRARLAALFPRRDAAVIAVRLRGGLSSAARAEAIRLVRAAVAEPRFRLRDPPGGDPVRGFVVTGLPVVAEDVAGELAGSLVRLLGVAVLVMALVLAVGFRRRLTPLPVALGAVGIAYGTGALAGRPLTLASLAVLPILLGLGVDYAVQLRAGAASTRTLATAGLATAAGFLVLLLSPVPMVRGFGALLVVGVVAALGLALLVGGGDPAPPIGTRAGSAAVPPATALVALARRPAAVLALAVVAALAGWGLESRTRVDADPRALVPRELPAMHDLATVEGATGIAGEIDVLVEGRDVATPAAVAWMRGVQRRVLARTDLKAAPGLPDLVGAGDPRRALAALPAAAIRPVLAADRRRALLAFGLPLLPLERQRAAVDALRAELRSAPAGIDARAGGLPVLAADANAALGPLHRAGTTLLGLLAAGLVLLAVQRSWRAAWIPLAPIALATGWSSLVLALLGVELNPLSATLGTLVVAVATEFAVLLAARYRELRASLAPGDALAVTYATTGAAVLVSGLTALAGFAVLIASEVRMLREFGLVTVVDLGVALVGVLVVLPVVLLLAERERAPAQAPAAASASA